mmetsp:Transcript_4265/g.14108  ORF Transcript_4265/g.14108 Transcript_4265/m.14108 type:complete len:443 (+) Transcript_4265:625-1953(+)
MPGAVAGLLRLLGRRSRDEEAGRRGRRRRGGGGVVRREGVGGERRVGGEPLRHHHTVRIRRIVHRRRQPLVGGGGALAGLVGGGGGLGGGGGGAVDGAVVGRPRKVGRQACRDRQRVCVCGVACRLRELRVRSLGTAVSRVCRARRRSGARGGRHRARRLLCRRRRRRPTSASPSSNSGRSCRLGLSCPLRQTRRGPASTPPAASSRRSACGCRCAASSRSSLRRACSSSSWTLCKSRRCTMATRASGSRGSSSSRAAPPPLACAQTRSAALSPRSPAPCSTAPRPNAWCGRAAREPRGPRRRRPERSPGRSGSDGHESEAAAPHPTHLLGRPAVRRRRVSRGAPRGRRPSWLYRFLSQRVHAGRRSSAPRRSRVLLSKASHYPGAEAARLQARCGYVLWMRDTCLAPLHDMLYTCFLGCPEPRLRCGVDLCEEGGLSVVRL